MKVQELMIDQLITKLLKTSDYKLEKYQKGLSNNNYLLEVRNQKYIVRIPYEASAALFNRNHEAKVMKLCEDLDLEVIYFNNENGIKITKFLSDVVDYDECLDIDKTQRAAKLIKTLHQKPVPDFTFNPIDKLNAYRNKVTKPILDLTPYETIITQIQALDEPLVLCHNDLVAGNLLFSDKRDYLIDYEYAAANSPLFDVMSFISENNINEKQRQCFYETYFDHIDDELLNKLNNWENFHNLLWCNWAMMMYEQLNSPIYQEIASAKYHALVNNFHH